jgi:hypothetical protein
MENAFGLFFLAATVRPAPILSSSNPAQRSSAAQIAALFGRRVDVDGIKS